MASIQQRGSRWQLRIKHALLPRPFFHTFDTEAEAIAYGQQLEALLRAGVVPAELMQPAAVRDDPVFSGVIATYLRLASPAPSDVQLLTALHGTIRDVRVGGITIQWVEQYVRDLKIISNNAPGTIRKKVESLGRVLAWHLRRVTPNGEHPPANPFRLMPRGYSVYSEKDKADMVTDRDVAKSDIVRDRRLSRSESELIDGVLAGEKRADRERRFTDDPWFPVMYRIIVNTGMRLSEVYRLRVEQVDAARGVINVEGSKGHRGKLKPRVVPMVRELRELLSDKLAGRNQQELIFPYWDGLPTGRTLATSRLSHRFKGLFAYANIHDFTEHDLRHEATCRWFEMRNAQGGWLFSEIEICRLMGWTDTRMALRYASIRGEDLAARLL